MATLRELGAAGIRLIGLYFAGRAVALYAALMATPLILPPSAFSSGDPALAASLSSGVASVVLALVGLLGANRIAAAVFAPTPLNIGSTRRDGLFVGVVLLGLWMAADAVAALLRSAGTIAFYSQQPIPMASLERSWPRLVSDAVTLFTGAALAFSARALVARLDPQ